MDFNKAGLIIGVFALLLAVPLAVIANLVTPLCREWYVSRNRVRRRERIAKLKSRLYDVEHTWKFTLAEWELYRSTYYMHQTFLGFTGMVLALVSSSLTTIGFGRKEMEIPHHVRTISGSVGILLLLPYFLATLFFALKRIKFQEIKNLHSLDGGEGLKKELVKLQEYEISIIEGRYGVRDLRVDVTKQLNDAIEDEKLHILVGNHLSGGDPCPNIPKDLIVEYRYKGQISQKRTNEGDFLDLP